MRIKIAEIKKPHIPISNIWLFIFIILVCRCFRWCLIRTSRRSRPWPFGSCTAISSRVDLCLTKLSSYGSLFPFIKVKWWSFTGNMIIVQWGSVYRKHDYCTVGMGILNTFKIPIVGVYSVFIGLQKGCHFVWFPMVWTIGKPNFWLAYTILRAKKNYVDICSSTVTCKIQHWTSSMLLNHCFFSIKYWRNWWDLFLISGILFYIQWTKIWPFQSVYVRNFAASVTKIVPFHYFR